MQQAPYFTHQNTSMCNMYVNPHGMRRLSPIFQPGRFDVICARGKMAYCHEGNKRFRALVKQHTKQYSAASSKHEKSKIVSLIVSSLRKASPEGGFIKKIDGSWFEVGDRHAKEKIGQTFRDLLHTKYSSSTKAKARARMQKNTKDADTEEDAKPSEDEGLVCRRQAVPDRRNSPVTRSGDETRSSVSVVSNGSIDIGNDEITVLKSNTGFPPLASVVVAKEERPKQGSEARESLPVRQSSRGRSRGQSRSLLDTFARSLDTLSASMFHGDNAVADLEPLPMAASSVRIYFKDEPSTASLSSPKDDDRFEDLTTDFWQDMTVAI